VEESSPVLYVFHNAAAAADEGARSRSLRRSLDCRNAANPRPYAVNNFFSETPISNFELATLHGPPRRTRHTLVTGVLAACQLKKSKDAACESNAPSSSHFSQNKALEVVGTLEKKKERKGRERE
jgi:hypothetical protein